MRPEGHITLVVQGGIFDQIECAAARRRRARDGEALDMSVTVGHEDPQAQASIRLHRQMNAVRRLDHSRKRDFLPIIDRWMQKCSAEWMATRSQGLVRKHDRRQTLAMRRSCEDPIMSS